MSRSKTSPSLYALLFQCSWQVVQLGIWLLARYVCTYFVANVISYPTQPKDRQAGLGGLMLTCSLSKYYIACFILDLIISISISIVISSTPCACCLRLIFWLLNRGKDCYSNKLILLLFSSTNKVKKVPPLFVALIFEAAAV